MEPEGLLGTSPGAQERKIMSVGTIILIILLILVLMGRI